MMPALIIFYNYKVKDAVGTSLASIPPKVLVGLATYFIVASFLIEPGIAFFAILGSVVGAWFGVYLESKLSGKIVSKLFVLLLIVIGLHMVGLINIPVEPIYAGSAPLLVLFGLIAGVAASFFGIGGGILLVPGLVMFFGLTLHEAIPTSLAIILPTTLTGAYFQNNMHHVNKKVLKYLIPMSLVGAVLGAIATIYMEAITLQYLFGIMILLASVKIFLTK